MYMKSRVNSTLCDSADVHLNAMNSRLCLSASSLKFDSLSCCWNDGRNVLGVYILSDIWMTDFTISFKTICL